VNLTANSAYSSIAPFYPAEAVKKGLPPATLGLIFSGYSISMCVFAPLFGSMLTNIGRKNVLMLGCLCESIAMFCFGLFIYIDDPVTYGVLSFLCRFIEGFGNGCLNSSSSSIISYNYEDNMSNLIGLTQTFTGLGMLSGPIVGSFLYEWGGFKLPFFVTGFCLFMLIFPIQYYLKNDKGSSQAGNQIQEAGPAQPSSATNRRKLSFFEMLKVFPIMSTAMCMSASLMCLTFKEPLL
jgi:MFS family permease